MVAHVSSSYMIYPYRTFTNGGKNFKSSPEVYLDHQCCFEQKGLKAKERLLRWLFNINSVILRKGAPKKEKNLKSAIQETISYT